MVSDNAGLDALCASWRHCEFLAMDTEFIRTSTFFPQAGLFQVNTGDERNYLVDPLVMTDWTAFRELMLDSRIVKVMHSCSEDLQVFMASMQLVPAPVFDTQIAGAFLKDGFGCSYQTLVRDYLGIELPKGETRSDWLQRPLADKQLHYAALDVACLPAIYQAQRKVLTETGRLGWLEEECDKLLDIYRKEMQADFSDFYLNMRGAWQLDRRQLQALKLLAQWREQRARKRNKPRNWIVQDKQLIDIARLMPASPEALSQVPDLDRNFMRHESLEVLATVHAAESVPEAALPALLPRPLDGGTKQRLKRGQQFVDRKAGELGLPVEMLSRKRWLVELLQNLLVLEKGGQSVDDADKVMPKEMLGWRRTFLDPGLLQAMRK